MMHPSPRRVMLVIAALFASLLTACHSAPTRLYTLYGVAPSTGARADYAGAPLRVDAVHFPPALDRIEVVSDVAPGQLSLSDFDHWSAPLGEVARQALSADLVARLPAGKTIFPHLAKTQGVLGVSVDVLDFKTDRGEIALQASWTIATAGQAPSASGNATLSTPTNSSGATAIAQGLSVLLGQIADRIVAGL